MPDATAATRALDPLVDALFRLAGLDPEDMSRLRRPALDLTQRRLECVTESLASFLACVGDDMRHGDLASLLDTMTGLVNGCTNTLDLPVARTFTDYVEQLRNPR